MEGGEEGGEPEGWGGAVEGATRKVHAAAAGAATGEPGSGGGRRGQIGLLRLLRCDCFERTKANPIAHTPRVRDTSPHDRHTIVHRSHARQTVRTCDTPAGSLYYTTTHLSVLSPPSRLASIFLSAPPATPIANSRSRSPRHHTHARVLTVLLNTRAAKHTHTSTQLLSKRPPHSVTATHMHGGELERGHIITRAPLSLCSPLIVLSFLRRPPDGCSPHSDRPHPPSPPRPASSSPEAGPPPA